MTNSLSFCTWATVKPIPVELASTKSRNSFEKSGYAKIEAETKARLSLSNASTQDFVHSNLTHFLVRESKGLAMCAKPFTKRLQ